MAEVYRAPTDFPDLTSVGGAVYATKGKLGVTATGTSGQVLTSAGAGAAPSWQTPSAGTVTSVAATVPTGLSISGSPITTAGTLAVSLTSGYMIPGGGSSGQVLTSQGSSAPVWAAAAGGGGLILIEKQTITSAVTDVTFSGLDGDTDKVYLLMGRIIVPSGGSNPVFTWQPNGITTNQSSQRMYANGGATAADQTSNLWLLDGIVATTVSFSVTIHASKVENSVAMIRNHFGTFQAIYGAGTIAVGTVSGQWNETSTNITSIVVHSSVASKIGNGSTIALYRLEQ